MRSILDWASGLFVAYVLGTATWITLRMWAVTAWRIGPGLLVHLVPRTLLNLSVLYAAYFAALSLLWKLWHFPSWFAPIGERFLGLSIF